LALPSSQPELDGRAGRLSAQQRWRATRRELPGRWCCWHRSYRRPATACGRTPSVDADASAQAGGSPSLISALISPHSYTAVKPYGMSAFDPSHGLFAADPNSTSAIANPFSGDATAPGGSKSLVPAMRIQGRPNPVQQWAMQPGRHRCSRNRAVSQGVASQVAADGAGKEVEPERSECSGRSR
jgi:hypothetical protein